MRAQTLTLALMLLLSGSQTGCIKQMALGSVANALAAQSDTFSGEPDVELAEAAIPFGLKTMEGVLESKPEHEGLLLALASGFTSYAYGFVEQDAFALKYDDLERSQFLLQRAYGLYFRARDYGFRSLEVDHEGFAGLIQGSDEDVDRVMARMQVGDVPKLYWAAAAWGLGIAASGFDPAQVVDLPRVQKMVERALELDETWERGALHEFMIVLETYLPNGSLEQAEEHYRRALELTEGKRAGTYVSFAENICVKRQDGPGFVEHLNLALAVAVEELPSERLANTINQRRARRLLAWSGELFIDDPLENELSMNVSLAPAVSWESP